MCGGAMIYKDAKYHSTGRYERHKGKRSAVLATAPQIVSDLNVLWTKMNMD